MSYGHANVQLLRPISLAYCYLLLFLLFPRGPQLQTLLGCWHGCTRASGGAGQKEAGSRTRAAPAVPPPRIGIVRFSRDPGLVLSEKSNAPESM